MSAVFSHGRLRLYLLKLLGGGPKHGYELIRLLENRFLGLYAPSAGTIYPRLARMEADGLVTHTAAGGRKVYEITEAGRAELAQRADELAALEAEIHASVADLGAVAEQMEQGVRGSARDLKKELRAAARQVQGPRTQDWKQWRAEWERGTREPAPAPPAAAGAGTEVERAADLLVAEVRDAVARGQGTPDNLRVAAALIDSVRDQVRRLIGG
ncbi:PadR family transcriptional regulator [Luedemannella helvata]|uniref:Transcription regulator PadR N-terminal domain-containing protein n=1 Tax=Luedemannella helvata TaxID=349315 RepID=A0ABP4VTB7_9ACTN